MHLFSFIACHKQPSKSCAHTWYTCTHGMAPSSCLSPSPGRCPSGRAELGPPANPCLLRVCNVGASIGPLGLCLMLCCPKIQGGADGCGQAPTAPCVHPRAVGAGGGLVPSCRLAGGGYGGFTFLTGQMFAFFSPSICSHALFWEVVNAALRARLRLQEFVSLVPSEAIVGFLAVLGLRLMEEMCGENVFYLKDA